MLNLVLLLLSWIDVANNPVIAMETSQGGVAGYNVTTTLIKEDGFWTQESYTLSNGKQYGTVVYSGYIPEAKRIKLFDSLKEAIKDAPANGGLAEEPINPFKANITVFDKSVAFLGGPGRRNVPDPIAQMMSQINIATTFDWRDAWKHAKANKTVRVEIDGVKFIGENTSFDLNVQWVEDTQIGRVREEKYKSFSNHVHSKSNFNVDLSPFLAGLEIPPASVSFKLKQDTSDLLPDKIRILLLAP